MFDLKKKNYICTTKCCFQNVTVQPKCVNIFSTQMLLSLFKVQKSRKPRIYLVLPSTLCTPLDFLSPVPRNIFTREISRSIVKLIAPNDKRQEKEIKKKDALPTSMMRGLSIGMYFFSSFIVISIHIFVVSNGDVKTLTQKTRGETQV